MKRYTLAPYGVKDHTGSKRWEFLSNKDCLLRVRRHEAGQADSQAFVKFKHGNLLEGLRRVQHSSERT